MSLKKLMTTYADYNVWANQTLVDWLRSKPAEVLEKEVASSFPSIAQTITHIWDTERFWFCVLTETPPPPSFRFVAYNGTALEAMEELLKQSNDFAAYIWELSDEAFLETRHLDTPWVQGTLPIYEFIQHVFNHSTYHRGQVITIGRNVDLTDAPMTDYNFYNMVVLRAHEAFEKPAHQSESLSRAIERSQIRLGEVSL
jgi:uncharacterized damage-inducible protein DinB